MRKIITTNDIQLLISLLSGFLGFLPLMVGVPSNFESSTLRDSIRSKHFEYSSLVLLSLALPLAIELAFEIFSTTGTKDQPVVPGTGTGTGTSSYVAMNRHELVLFLIGICITPLLVCFPDDAPDLGHLYLCFSKSQLALVGGVFMIWLCRFNSRYWSPLSTTVVLICLLIHTSLLVWADNVIAINPSEPPPFMYVVCHCHSH